jgi:hypothetical protein
MNNPQPDPQSDELRGRSSRWALDPSKLREASWLTIVAVVIAGATAVTVFNMNRTAIVDSFQPLYTTTGGLVQPTLIVNLVLIGVVVVGLILWFGRLQPRDIGLDLRDLWIGIVITVGTWALMQVTGVIAVLVQGKPLGLNESWTTIGTLAIIGGFVAQLFGNALYEEIVYRAFLVPQFAKKFSYQLPSSTPRTVFVLALLVSQAVFGLIHAPSRLAQGVAIGGLPVTILVPFLIGILFALVYYRTANLFVTVGLHALVNDPVLLVNASAIAALPVLLVLLAVLLIWPSLVAKFGGGKRTIFAYS